MIITLTSPRSMQAVRNRETCRYMVSPTHTTTRTSRAWVRVLLRNAP